MRDFGNNYYDADKSADDEVSSSDSINIKIIALAVGSLAVKKPAWFAITYCVE